MKPSPSIPTGGALIKPRSADLLLAWVDAADDAEAAYRTWCGAPRDAEADAYCVYLAALDREEAAARAMRANVRA